MASRHVSQREVLAIATYSGPLVEYAPQRAIGRFKRRVQSPQFCT